MRIRYTLNVELPGGRTHCVGRTSVNVYAYVRVGLVSAGSVYPNVTYHGSLGTAMKARVVNDEKWFGVYPLHTSQLQSAVMLLLNRPRGQPRTRETIDHEREVFEQVRLEQDENRTAFAKTRTLPAVKPAAERGTL